MTQWKQTIEVNKIVNSYSGNEKDVRKIAKKVVAELKKHDVIPEEIVDGFKKVKTEGGFNFALQRLYDFCDNNKIWLGLAF